MFRTNPGTWKLGVFWERTYAKSPKIEQNRPKSPRTEPGTSGTTRVRTWLGTLFKDCTRTTAPPNAGRGSDAPSGFGTTATVTPSLAPVSVAPPTQTRGRAGKDTWRLETDQP